MFFYSSDWHKKKKRWCHKISGGGPALSRPRMRVDWGVLLTFQQIVLSCIACGLSKFLGLDIDFSQQILLFGLPAIVATLRDRSDSPNSTWRDSDKGRTFICPAYWPESFWRRRSLPKLNVFLLEMTPTSKLSCPC